MKFARYGIFVLLSTMGNKMLPFLFAGFLGLFSVVSVATIHKESEVIPELGNDELEETIQEYEVKEKPKKEKEKGCTIIKSYKCKNENCEKEYNKKCYERIE